MRIDCVTITGLDNFTNLEAVRVIQKNYPFVEWGVLFSRSSNGKPRYPSIELIHMLAQGDHGLRLSCHLCGGVSKDILEGGKCAIMGNLNQRRNFDRFQLNYAFNRRTVINPALLDWMKKNAHCGVILQVNAGNRAACNTASFFEGRNFQFLFDASAGQGKNLRIIQEPYKQYTGYAGGLSPDNIAPFLDRLQEAGEFGKKVWIDMESGVRTGDRLDLDKVRAVLDTCHSFM